MWAGQTLAQSAVPLNNSDLSKETENPVARQITVPLRQNRSRLACPSHRGVKSFMSEAALSSKITFLRLKCRILHSGHWYHGPNYAVFDARILATARNCGS